MAWKRVYVPGKGWRYTDGKGNYKQTNPSRSQYRNAANDVVDAGANATKKGVQKVGDSAKQSIKATSEAAGRTAKNEDAAKTQAIGYKARKDREREQTQVKPQSLTQRDRRIGNTDVSSLRQAQNDAIKAYNKKKQEQAKPQPTNKQDGGGQPRTYASASPRTTTASVTEPKPIPKPAGKVPASSETYRDGGKGLYQGTKEYRDKVGGSGNPLLNRFRQDMGRDAGSGSKAEPKMSKPEDKSKYVASNGKPYMGPAFGSGKAEPAKPASPASPNKSEKGMTLAERMRRRRQSGMA
jgi:hypothetical protein